MSREAEVIEAFKNAEQYHYLKFESIPNDRRLHHRADINAFLLLDKFIPGDRNVVRDAEHDEFYLNITVEQLIESDIDEVQIEDLVRSGVLYNEEDEVFYMNA